MNFREAVEATEHLHGKWQEGLRALRPQDRAHIRVEVPRRLRGSVDVDSALRQAAPQANRWDFAIGYQHRNRDREFVYWVEVHTANDREVDGLLAKFSWLKSWLAHGGANLRTFEREFVWLSSGATAFTRATLPRLKKMARAGLHHRGRLCIREERRVISDGSSRGEPIGGRQ